MGITYTEEQRQVIDTHGCNILVSAAAGSGKTAVLTERIVKMISDEKHPVDIDRLLVVTFTNAAAAEMRERIGAAIARRLEDEPENGHLQKQATLIHNAQITTIDSFCMFVIRNNFNDIGLDPGFRVADEGELKLMKQDVMKELLEGQFARKEEAFLHCVEYFSTGNRDDAIEGHILKLYQFAESNPWPEEWLEERKGDYRVADTEELEKAEFIRFGVEQAALMAEDCLQRMEECLKICGQPDGPYMYGEVLEREAEALGKLASVKSYKEGYALFQGMSFGRLPSKKDDTVSGQKRELVQQIRKEIKETVKRLCGKFFPLLPETAVEYMKGSEGAVAVLIDLTLAFKEALDKKKRENNIIDFSDMEHLALSILVKKADGKEKAYEPSRTALDYRDYFEEILIDEYQDSNPVQEMLLESISGEDNGKFNRFMVGDVKQSIYKFRLARPEIFMEKYEAYGKEGTERRRIDLHRNFRSRAEVLDSVNFIFSRIMGKRLGGVEYDKAAALYPGASYPAHMDRGDISPNRTELLLIQKEKAEDSGDDIGGQGNAGKQGEEGEKKISDRQREAYAVARRIKELMEGFPVTDKESGELRRASYRDIVILLRTNAGWDEDFKSVLKEEGIPSHVLSRTGYFAAQEIRTLLQLLRVLDNPGQDIPLFGVLKSCFGGFTDREIAWMKGKTEEGKKGLYTCLKEWGRECGDECGTDGDEAAEEENKIKEEKEKAREERVSAAGEEEALQKKARDFLRFLEAYRDKTVYMPIHELLQDIVTETGYMHYIAALPGGGQRRANVQMLLEKAAAFEQTSYYGLFHFVRYMEQLEKYDVDYGEANILDENADVVRIMSIHKSKGLEFPICFVCGLAKKFNLQDISGKMIADMDMGIGVDYVDVERRMQGKTVRKNMIGEKMRLDSLGEELRVLYVALTRAKEKLIMTGIVDKLEKKLPVLALASGGRSMEKLAYGRLAEAGSYLDILLPALAVHPSFGRLLGEYGEEYGWKWEGNLGQSEWDHAEMEIRIISEEDLLGAEIRDQMISEGTRRKLENSDLLTDVDSEWMTEVSGIFALPYQHANLADLYTKTTVSELKKTGQKEEKNFLENDFSFRLYESEEEHVIPYIPKFMKAEESLGGAGRGTAFHRVMELLDLGENAEQLEKQIEQMLRTGRLAPEYAKAVSVPAIRTFLSTDLAKRMRTAGQSGRLYREQPFVLGLPADELNGKFPADELVLIQGVIDVYFEEDGELVVADYKTDQVENGRELVEKYRKQLEYYARALQQLTGKKVKEKIIYSFRLHEEIVL